jgi:hypothetical protein
MAGQDAMPEAGLPCPTCGYLADPGVGPANFCPKCGQDLRPGAPERTRSLSMLGLVVADRYKLIAHLGDGGMGSVYKAEHIRMGKALAVKILRGDFDREASAVERFRSEARIVSRLSHPHTIAVFDFGEIEALGGFYLAMEYVPGRDLARVLREDGSLPEARVADIGQQILGSLAEAHQAGIVHRDMKPGNVMLMQTGPGEDFAKVLDFGIAKLRDEASTSQTGTGSIVGTPNYLSPEQARGDRLDARADLYAVGCVLYELVCGQAPFAGRSPMAVVNAHLHEAPPPLDLAAPGTSRRLVQLVHKALAKRPEDRFASADEMREAILALGEPTSTRSLAPSPQLTGELKIARREDFAEFERQVRALRRRRLLAPLWALVLALLAGGLVWRWNDVYGQLSARAPAVAARLPEALRPADRYDGEEHEPNDDPAHANPLPLPPGPDGAPAGGVVTVRGTIGARSGPTSGDVDVYRIVVPPSARSRDLVASWHADGSPDGIRGLDVALALNRTPTGDSPGTSAPLVASVDRGGPGRPERLIAPVEPGTYYLSVRERHDEATGPVEKPTDPYLLEVRLADHSAGQEVEPNDSPEQVGLRSDRYAGWRAMAKRNPLPEAVPVRGEIGPGDVDVFAAAPEGRLVLALPSAGIALSVRTWSPELADVDQAAPGAVRFEPAGQAGPGEPLVVQVHTFDPGAPPLVQLRAEEGTGPYRLLLLGGSSASGALAVEEVEALSADGRLPAALELAAAFARYLPHSPGRTEVLALAGRLAREAAPALTPEEVVRFERTAQLLGAPPFDQEGGQVRYRAAFEQRVEGKGPAAEEAGLLVVRLSGPCSPTSVAERVEAFVARFPASRHAAAVRLWRARALELVAAAEDYRDAASKRLAVAAWERVARGPAAAEAKSALARLRAKTPPTTPPTLAAVCPDPGAD